MDYDLYVAARRSRLVEQAEARGRTPDEAEAVVDRLLLRHRRDITRADDPHPILVDALADLLDGGAGTPRRTPALLTWLPLGLLALVVALVAGAVLLGLDGGGADDDADPPIPSPSGSPSGPPDPCTNQGTCPPTGAGVPTGDVVILGRTMPLLLGYDEQQAAALLGSLGLVAVDKVDTSCAPAQLVIGSFPAPGDPVASGQRVTLFTSAGPGETTCPPERADDEAAAWQFVRFVAGRADAPSFAPEIRVVIDGAAPRFLRGRDAAMNGFDGLSQYFNGFRGVDTVSGEGDYPQLTALHTIPPKSRCGVARPETFGSRQALRATLESLDLGDDDTCALTVDLYTDSQGRVDGVALYRTPRVADDTPIGPDGGQPDPPRALADTTPIIE